MNRTENLRLILAHYAHHNLSYSSFIGTVWLHKIINCMLGCAKEQSDINAPIELSLCGTPDENELLVSPKVYEMVESWTSPRVMFTHLLPPMLPVQLPEKAKVISWEGHALSWRCECVFTAQYLP